MEEVGKNLQLLFMLEQISTPETCKIGTACGKMGVDAVSSIPAVYYRLSPASVKATTGRQ